MRDVAIFWDYDNCSAPYNASGYVLANNIRLMAQPYGSVKSLKAYLTITDQLTAPRAIALRSELQVSGVSLIDCPHNGRKEVADKMMIVDMLAHAIDNPAPCTIILITGDRDFAYAMSILRLRQYEVVLVTLPNAHPSLTAQASVCIDWHSSILSRGEHTSARPWTSNPSNTNGTGQAGPSQSQAPAQPPLNQSAKASGEDSETLTGSADQGDIAQYLRSATRYRRISNSSVNVPLGYQGTRTVHPRPENSPMIELKLGPSPPGPSPMATAPQVDSGATVCNIWPLLDSPAAPTSILIPSGNTQSHSAWTDTSNTTQWHSLPQSPSSDNNYMSLDSISIIEESTGNGDPHDRQDAPGQTNNFDIYDVPRPASAPTTLPSLPTPTIFNVVEPSVSVALQCREPEVSMKSKVGPHLKSLGDLDSVHPPGLVTPTPTLPSAVSGSSSSITVLPDISGLKKPKVSAPVSAPKHPVVAPPSPLVVPPIFEILVKALQNHKATKKHPRALFSDIGMTVSRNGTYKKAGVKKFSQYVALAEKAGLVTLGGTGGTTWISLTPSWINVKVI